MAKLVNLDLLHHKLKAFQIALLKVTDDITTSELLAQKLILSDMLSDIMDKYLHLKPIGKLTEEEKADIAVNGWKGKE